jgi:hypothetical protein
MKKYKRNSIFDELKEYCVLAGDHDFIEITEWANGEGFDVEITSKLSQRFQLTWGEFKALKKLVKSLEI